MIAKIVLGFMLVVSCSAHADTPNAELLRSRLGDENVTPIEELEAIAAPARATMNDVDIPLELGDGYFDLLNGVYYEVRSTASGVVVGYISAAILSYTEDEDYRLVTIYVDPNGRIMNPDWVSEAETLSEDDLRELPLELQIPN